MSIKWILTKTTGYQEIFLNNYMFVINIGVWVCQYNKGRLLSNKKNKCKMVHTSYILKHHVIYGKNKTKSMEEIWLIFATQCTKHGRLRPGALSAAERSYPGQRSEAAAQSARLQRRRNGGEELPKSEVRGGREEHPEERWLRRRRRA